MTLHINIPDDAAKVLRDAWGESLDRAALEAMVVEGYRSGKFGVAQVRRALGFRTRWEAERWLGDRGVSMNYGREELDADRAALDRLFGKSG